MVSQLFPREFTIGLALNFAVRKNTFSCLDPRILHSNEKPL
jgi:hypothetical protein